MSRSEPAYAKTLACQGHDMIILTLGAETSDAAVWSVTTNGSKFTGGTLLATYSYDYPSLTCAYELDPANSSFYSFNGIVVQDLAWVLYDGDCDDYFEDNVYLISNGTASVMNDDNLDDDEVAGSGTCIWL